MRSSQCGDFPGDGGSLAAGERERKAGNLRIAVTSHGGCRDAAQIQAILDMAGERPCARTP